MEKDWIEYQCKSGQTLFTYNKETGEHHWPLGLPEGIEYRIIYSYPIERKQVSTTATQTDDNGCNNGCMSMYISTDQSHVSNTSDAMLPNQNNLMKNASSNFQAHNHNFYVAKASREDCSQSEFHINVQKTEGSVGKDAGMGGCSGDLVASGNTNSHERFYGDMDRSHAVCSNENDGYSVNRANADCDVKPVNADVTTGNTLTVVFKQDEDIKVISAIDEKEFQPQSEMSTILACQNVVSCHPNLPEIKPVTEYKPIQQRCPAFRRRRRVYHRNHTVPDVLHQCSYCGKRFDRKFNLVIHLRTHTGEKPYECKICKKKFSQSSNLTEHMKTHTGEKTVECSICKKRFTHRSTLSNHLKIHDRDKPFECSICKEKFAETIALEFHVRTHR